MKRAKIMLTGMAVVALVGGALAFKAAKFNDPNLYTCSPTTTIPGAPKVCWLTALNSITGLAATVDPTLVFTTRTTTHLGTPGCTTTINGVTYGCYDHPVHVFINQ